MSAPAHLEPVPGNLQFSPAETRVLHLVAQGLNNLQIAKVLYLSHRTIGSHIHNMLKQTGFSERTIGEMNASGLLEQSKNLSVVDEPIRENSNVS
jgi:DNA-binding NarL/FixJ family response regulator